MLLFWEEWRLKDFKQHACKCSIGNCQLLPFIKFWKCNIHVLDFVMSWIQRLYQRKPLTHSCDHFLPPFYFYFSFHILNLVTPRWETNKFKSFARQFFFKFYFQNSFKKEKNVVKWNMDACQNELCILGYMMHAKMLRCMMYV